jgi:hypothetical protein
MEIKLQNGTVFIIETEGNAISIKKLNDATKETTEIFTRKGCRFTIDDNMLYIG